MAANVMGLVRHPLLKLWVCESCGVVWELPTMERPVKDHDGRVLCESCRLFAGIDGDERRP